MLPCRIVRDEIEVDVRLAQFGTTRAECRRIIHAVVTAHNDAVPYDPKTAAGLFRYIYGTRAVRDTLCPKGYQADSDHGVESAYDHTGNRKIIYQSVDCAADEGHDPMAISGKGPAAERTVERSTMRYLFPEMEEEARRAEESLQRRANAEAWFFCVSINGDDVRAELSLPRSVQNENFKQFIERIFIVEFGDWDDGGIIDLDNAPDGDEIEPIVTKKA
jgi:hypothetical protein